MPDSLIPAVGYVRMSSDDQFESPAQQRTAIEELACRAGYRILRWYEDHGTSGSKEIHKRRRFLEMIDDAEDLRDFKAVLVWRSDRFGRLDGFESAPFKMRLRDAGVMLHSVAEGVIDWSTEAGVLLDAVQTMQASSMPRKMAEDVVRGKIHAAKQGRPAGGQPPYGMARLIISPEGKRTVVPRGERYNLPRVKKGRSGAGEWQIKYVEGDPEELATVRWIFQQIADRDWSCNALADDLNSRGVPSPAGGRWRPLTVRNVLRNKSYVGTYELGKTHPREAFFRLTKDGAKRQTGPGGRAGSSTQGAENEILAVADLWDPVVDPDLFKRANEAYSQRERSGRKPRAAKRPYALHGILRCGGCGLPMYGQRQKRKRGEVVRYFCGGFSNRTSDCPGWAIEEELVLRPLTQALLAATTDEQVRRYAETVSAGRPDVRAGLVRRIEQATAAIERGTRRVVNIESDDLAKAVLSEVDRLNSERADLETQLRVLDATPDVAKKVRRWREQFVALRGQRLDVLALRRLLLDVGCEAEARWREAETRTRSGKWIPSSIRWSLQAPGWDPAAAPYRVIDEDGSLRFLAFRDGRAEQQIIRLPDEAMAGTRIIVDKLRRIVEPLAETAFALAEQKIEESVSNTWSGRRRSVLP